MITFVTFHVHYRTELGVYLEDSQIYRKESILARFRRTAKGKISYGTMLEILFKSIDLTHSANRKVLLTDCVSAFPWPDGLMVDIIRSNVDVTKLMLSRLRAQVNYLRTCDERSHHVFVDSDMIVNRDLTPIFSRTFDVALTYRANHPMPINGGVIFIHRDRLPQAREVFSEMLDIYETRYLDHDVWWGDQFALRDVLRLHSETLLQEGFVSGLPYRILLLDTQTYNYSAAGMGVLAHTPEKYLLHFKSWRKDYMAAYWERWVLTKRSPSFIWHSLRLRCMLVKRKLRGAVRKAYHLSTQWRGMACKA